MVAYDVCLMFPYLEQISIDIIGIFVVGRVPVEGNVRALLDLEGGLGHHVGPVHDALGCVGECAYA